MPIFTKPLPLSLYIHIPWCVRKCPYCDFNSHEAKQTVPEELYVAALLGELDHHAALIKDRPPISIFFGGGTPSLFSPQAIGQIIDGAAQRLPLSSQAEITLEANPGTIDQRYFRDYRQAGINRLSLGVQSFQDEKLKALGRIHDSQHAQQAVEVAIAAGFSNFNIDLMYGLPNQTIADALHDLNTAIRLAPTHLSWYQLTIEPNTLFHHRPPVLPIDDTIWEMQLAGQACLKEAGFTQYEVSAYARNNKDCLHNRNYWEFGDYLGIGAGAHSKITDPSTQTILRFSQIKHPRDYLDVNKRHKLAMKAIAETDIAFEFMLNALRLTNGVEITLFSERTGLSIESITPLLEKAKKRGLLENNPMRLCPTELGKKFLNDLVGIFLSY